ncbi:MAG TPA: M20/M25/M40 family metallo-hydrolase [Bacteroidales bacterium]|nr:M20/M25/M40 family metallo-hydrolase [Bacteroidales bacterium]HPS17036.1 M20/M25/M40 family metallo-hydrolase [Bacteroidales bacterium]
MFQIRRSIKKIYKISLVIFICSISIQYSFSQTDTPEKILSDYIKIKSTQGYESEAGIFLSNFCSSKGLHVKIFSDEDSSYNFAASLYPLSTNKPNIILLNHLDVVPANDSTEWQFPPFSGTIYNNKVWGRGAIDCKGLAVIQLMAMLPFIDAAKEKDLPYNVTLLSVSGEETNSEKGAGLITSKFLNELNPIVVFGEGGAGVKNVISSDTTKLIFGISVSEKKSLWLKLDVYSESFSHGAVSSDLYANKKLLRVLIKLLDEKKYIKFDDVLRNMFRKLGNMEGGIRGFFIKRINWDIFWPLLKKEFEEGKPLHLLVYNTFTITNISNPNVPSNQIASNASAILDCRLLPGTDSAKFIKKIKNTVGPKVKVTVLSSNPDALASPLDTFYLCMEKKLKEKYPGCEVMPVLFPATTDNNYFRNKGINTYGIIPVYLSMQSIQSTHNKNEQISIEELYKGIEVFKSFISDINKKE